jgi:hypothetical protein
MSFLTPGPCETLARLSLQSERYQKDAEFREAVDAVLGHPVYDHAPIMRASLATILRYDDEGKTVTYWTEKDSLAKPGHKANLESVRGILRTIEEEEARRQHPRTTPF